MERAFGNSFELKKVFRKPVQVTIFPDNFLQLCIGLTNLRIAENKNCKVKNILMLRQYF